MERGIRLRQLTYFVEAARNGSILKAAERLHVTQPALTSSLHDLEQKLGAKLLERHRSGVSLTEYGKLFIHHAENVLAEMNTGVARLESFMKAELGHVSVGAPPIHVHQWLAAAITQFKRRHPQVVVTVRPASNDIVLPLLKLGELDFVIGAPGSSAQMSGLTHDVLFRDRICLVARSGHPLASETKLTPKSLTEWPWFVPYPYAEFRDEMQAIFRSGGVSAPNNLVEANWNIAGDYLEQSDAVSILPYALVAEELGRGSLIELDAGLSLPVHPISIIRRDHGEMTATAQELIRDIRRVTSTGAKRPRISRRGRKGEEFGYSRL